MKRTTILADEGLLAEVGAIARRRGVSTSHAVREALELYVADGQAEQAKLPDFVGMFDLETDLTGATSEEIVRREFGASLQGD